MDERLIIFDTTLRDGEQSPGCSLNPLQKRRMAETLAQLGVDVIEAGYPNASEGDFRSVSEIAREVHGPTIAALARCVDADIRAAIEALTGAEKPRVHVFIAASPIHRQHKLRLSRPEVIERAVVGIRMARAAVAVEPLAPGVYHWRVGSQRTVGGADDRGAELLPGSGEAAHLRHAHEGTDGAEFVHVRRIVRKEAPPGALAGRGSVSGAACRGDLAGGTVDAFQPVAMLVDGGQAPAAGGIEVQLAAQPTRVCVDRPGVDVGTATPDALEDVPA